MKKLSPGAHHRIPQDIRQILMSNNILAEKWNDLTPLARNEWICWVISFKKEETRDKHLKRLQEDLYKGKKRPCCWPGCSHR